MCEGTVLVLEMDDTVVVAGYSDQGMEAWDVQTQQSLCTFINHEHGGVKALQFDNRKIASMSSTGKVIVAVITCLPVTCATLLMLVWCRRHYEDGTGLILCGGLCLHTPIACHIPTKFDDQNLVLGIDCGACGLGLTRNGCVGDTLTIT